MPATHVDVAAPLAEFTLLRKPDAASNSFWSTSIFRGEPCTFRVLDDDAMTPVSGVTFLNERLHEMHKHVQDGALHRAAELAYRSVLVEVSVLDDATALPSNTDCVVDLWLPLHVALMTGNTAAAKRLLQFHVEHAVEAMTCFANTPSQVTAVRGEGDGPMAPVDSADLDTVVVDEDSARDSVGEARGSGGGGGPAVESPILECQVRRELGGAVVLLGHFDGRIRHSSSAAVVRKSRAQSPVRPGPAASTPLPASTAATTTMQSASSCDLAASGTAVPPGSHEEALLQSVMQYNEALLREEMELFEDKGEEYCLVNVLHALRPLLQSVVFELERRWKGALPGSSEDGTTKEESRGAPAAAALVPETAMDLVHDFCSSLSGLPQHPPLLVGGSVLFDLCQHGSLRLLTNVMDAFEGTLAPVLRGQALLTDRQNGSGAALSSLSTAAAAAGGGGPASLSATTHSRPHTHQHSGAPSPPLSSLNLPALSAGASPAPHPASRDPSTHSVAHTPRGGSVGRHPHPPAPTPFWWSCRPQQVHHLAFMALWIGCREAVEENSGSGRRRRAAAITTENRVMMTTVRQLVESRVAAQKLSAMVWSGHLVTITKLLSRECTLEDFVDFVEEGGYLHVTAPSGFTGPFLSVLVAGVVAAAVVRDAATMKMLRRKVETLLADVPGRPSPLRAYVMSKTVTHAERFRELWMDAGSHASDGSSCRPDKDNEDGDDDSVGAAEGPAATASAQPPRKFRTRVELLYYAVVEQVLEAAEEAWTQEPEDAASSAAGAAPTSLWVFGCTKQEAQSALQSWLLMWTNFFTGLRDRPDHRRSLSYSSASSQQALQQPSSSSVDGPLTRERNTPRLQPAAAPHDGTPDDVLSDDTNEVTETIRKVCRVVVDRLESGAAPLPALRRALYPNGPVDVDSGLSGSATPAQVKALPTSSIDHEFTAAAQSFADAAAKESQEVQLKFYGLYKQATIGDVNISRPGFFDYAGKAKWDAWSKLKGMSLLDAKRAYVSEYKMMVDLRKAQK